MITKKILSFIGGGLFVMILLMLGQMISQNVAHLITERTYTAFGIMGGFFGVLFVKAIEKPELNKRGVK